MVAADQAAHLLGEAAAVEVFGYLHHVQVGVGDAVPLALGEGQQEADDAVLLARIEAAHHAEVHQRQAAVVGYVDVAGVGVAVEHAVDHDLLEVGR